MKINIENKEFMICSDGELISLDTIESYLSISYQSAESVPRLFIYDCPRVEFVQVKDQQYQQQQRQQQQQQQQQQHLLAPQQASPKQGLLAQGLPPTEPPTEEPPPPPPQQQPNNKIKIYATKGLQIGASSDSPSYLTQSICDLFCNNNHRSVQNQSDIKINASNMPDIKNQEKMENLNIFQIWQLIKNQTENINKNQKQCLEYVSTQQKNVFLKTDKKKSEKGRSYVFLHFLISICFLIFFQIVIYVLTKKKMQH